jgi:hypothetical protein
MNGTENSRSLTIWPIETAQSQFCDLAAGLQVNPASEGEKQAGDQSPAKIRSLVKE